VGDAQGQTAVPLAWYFPPGAHVLHRSLKSAEAALRSSGPGWQLKSR
jgi:hypothetical protein